MISPPKKIKYSFYTWLKLYLQFVYFHTYLLILFIHFYFTFIQNMPYLHDLISTYFKNIGELKDRNNSPWIYNYESKEFGEGHINYLLSITNREANRMVTLKFCFKPQLVTQSCTKLVQLKIIFSGFHLLLWYRKGMLLIFRFLD